MTRRLARFADCVDICQSDLDIGILQGAFAGGRRRALRARQPTHRPRYPVKFDTRHNSFGVLSSEHLRIVGRTSHARIRRGCLIVNPTLSGKKNQTFGNQPVFSCVLAAASVSTRINTRYQSDNRCRQRHRVRKAVFVQLISVCPKTFTDVIRSGQ
jgi:hypothetical protein